MPEQNYIGTKPALIEGQKGLYFKKYRVAPRLGNAVLRARLLFGGRRRDTLTATSPTAFQK